MWLLCAIGVLLIHAIDSTQRPGKTLNLQLEESATSITLSSCNYVVLYLVDSR